MKDKNGYTLIEILAIVAVLSIVVGLSITAFGNVQKNVLNKDYDNIKTYLETSAEQFASETGIYGIVTVQDLIEAGYVTPDDKNDEMYNPVDNKPITCNKIEIQRNNDNYIASFTEATQDLVDGKCNSTEKKEDLEICWMDGSTCREITPNTWFNSNELILGIKNNDDNKMVTDVDFNCFWPLTTDESCSIRITSNGIHSVSIVNKANPLDTGSTTKKIQFDKTSPTFKKFENNIAYYSDSESGVKQVCFFKDASVPSTCAYAMNNSTTNYGLSLVSSYHLRKIFILYILFLFEI